jgi:pyridoxamine 5'-phosphate oxidase
MSQYTLNAPLDVHELLPDPMAQLEVWLEGARAAGMIEPTAMTLATASPDGRPSARVVLYKGQHKGGPVFYTNHLSRKGRELDINPFVALVFWWDRLERQVRVEGRIEHLPRSLTEAYFASRPRESQLSAHASRQSEPVKSREILDARVAALDQQYAGAAIPCPEHWGGYRVQPEVVEFWQGRLGRTHDRLCYRRGCSGWDIERLEP